MIQTNNLHRTQTTEGQPPTLWIMVEDDGLGVWLWIIVEDDGCGLWFGSIVEDHG